MRSVEVRSQVCAAGTHSGVGAGSVCIVRSQLGLHLPACEIKLRLIQAYPFVLSCFDGDPAPLPVSLLANLDAQKRFRSL